MPPSPCACILCGLLQSSPHAPIAQQGCAALSPYPDYWPHLSTTNPGRIASSLCPDLVSDRDSGCPGRDVDQASTAKRFRRRKRSFHKAYISRMPVGVQVAVDIPGGRVPGQDDGGYESSEHYSEYYGHPDHVLTSSPADPLPTGRRSPSLSQEGPGIIYTPRAVSKSSRRASDSNSPVGCAMIALDPMT